MINERRQLWKIFKLHQQRGLYLNSPLIEEWRECGTVEASDEDAAAARAAAIIGNTGNAIRVEPVDEFYKPESLQP